MTNWQLIDCIWQTAGTLSGGNQQKVMLSRGLFANPDVLILDEPTRGIDVGSKYEIYSFMNKLVEEGKAVIFISSEMPELLGMCDRIFVLNEGHIIAELTGDEISQENIMEKILDGQNMEQINKSFKQTSDSME